LSGLDHPDNVDPADMLSTANVLRMQAEAIDRSIRLQSGLLEAIEVALALAAPLGGPAGMTAGMILQRGVKLIEAKRGL
jgi:hypothetical protein